MVCEYGTDGVKRYESVDADTLVSLPSAADSEAAVRLIIVDSGSSMARVLMERHEDLEQRVFPGATERAILEEMQELLATIFIPLTFIAGIYGMNFVHMPGLGWRWGYPTVLVSMVTIGRDGVIFPPS